MINTSTFTPQNTNFICERKGYDTLEFCLKYYLANLFIEEK